MTQTPDQLLARYEDQLQSILLAGFFCDERDAGQRYRQMRAKAMLLRERVRQMIAEIQAGAAAAPALPKPAPGNGAPAAKEGVKR